MVQPSGDACRAWQLLVRFFFAQREHLPTLDGELELSPIQCHVLHLLEPGRPLPMGRLAGMLGCHASNVTGLVDRLETRGGVLRQSSADDRRVKVLDLTRPRWHNEALLRQIRIDTALELGNVPPVGGELAPLREVLMNLVLNAIDAMPDGGRLGVKTWADELGVHCDVSDSGAGMSDEVRQRALDPFFTTKGPKSTGLGLSVTYGIIQRHNGKLEIDSTPGHGTTIHITLPSASPVVAPPRSLTTAPAPPAQLRVLLVDDEPEVRSALADMLGGSGHTAFQAAGGKEALAWLEAGQPIDLVLTDLGMPGMTGGDLARAVRGRWPHLRIGLMTGWDETEALVAETRSVVDFLIAKPFKLKALLEAYAQNPRIA
jgi:CheY-like chemotaxis protein